VEKFHAEGSPPPNMSITPEASPVRVGPNQAFLAAPAADEGIAQASLPGALPDATVAIEKFEASPGKIVPQRPDSARSSASVKSRPESAGSRAQRPTSAERARPGSAKSGKGEEKESKRPGSAGRNRDDRLKPSVWLTDKKISSRVDTLKDAEKNLDKDIFRNSPKKGKGRLLASPPPQRAVAREDPGPQRPTTAKRRENRPSSAERNRDETVQPSVWLDGISRDSKAGQRSFIDCNGTPAQHRPSSADRNRKADTGKKVKKKKSRVDHDRPSSAERNRGDKVNNKVWLEDKKLASNQNNDAEQDGERPSSAGQRRKNNEDKNGKVDQNGRPRSAEKTRPASRGIGLAPLKGTPGSTGKLKPIKMGMSAEI